MKPIQIFFVLFLAILARPGFCQWDNTHKAWNQVVSMHVQNGVVNYQAIKTSPESLDLYLRQLAEVEESDFKKWDKKEQMAYLINAYNAFTAKIIADFYPVESIRDIGAKVGGNIFNKTSKQWRISEYEVSGKKVLFKAMGKPITLDEIEHENLRPKYEDPRVHFALVCGAVSCPFLRSEAYIATKLDAQLEDQGRQFLADPFRNRYDEKINKLLLSKIFDWFEKDFKSHGSVVVFVKKYLPPATAALVTKATTVDYLDYDWSLNSKAGKH
jgi:hypothetical protein